MNLPAELYCGEGAGGGAGGGTCGEGAGFAGVGSVVGGVRIGLISNPVKIECGSWLACDSGVPDVDAVTDTLQSQASQLPQWIFTRLECCTTLGDASDFSCKILGQT
jgi:hypothetical protein